MRFYSYNYLLEQIAKFDWWGAALTIFLIICLIITMYKYHQGQKETKFRELAIILGLGTNIEPREQYLRKALEEISQRGIKITKQSKIYQTPAWGGVANQNFLKISINPPV